MISIGNNGALKKTAEEIYSKNEAIENLKNSLDKNDMVLITKLSNLKNTLENDKVNLRTIKQQISDITSFDKAQNFDYLNNLLKPEKAKGCKIPSQLPVPSCSFQLHNCVTVRTNSSGNCAFLFNPFFLASESAIGTELAAGDTSYFVHEFLSSFWVNNNDSLYGSEPNENWTPVNVGQVLPDVYDQYRLVSASLVVKYIGRLDIAAGVVGGAIIFDENDSLGGKLQAKSGSNPYNPAGGGNPTTAPDLTKYGNFDLAMDSFYHQENSCIEGVRELYFPMDNSFEEYVKVMDKSTVDIMNVGGNLYFNVIQDYYKSGFNWFFYCLGATPSANCFKVDFYCNFECLPNAKYMNYMPISINPYVISPEQKKKMILLAQSKPVLKSGEEMEEGEGQIPSLFNKMIKKFDSGLPGFDKLKSLGLMTAMPSFKPGLALASNMIIDNMDNY